MSTEANDNEVRRIVPPSNLEATTRSSPDTIPFQPKPRDTRVCHLRTTAGWVTAIWRDWAGRDGERCMLCPIEDCCLNEEGNCLKQYPIYIPAESARFFADPALAGNDLSRPGVNVHSG
jgi:hypothetical protein